MKYMIWICGASLSSKPQRITEHEQLNAVGSLKFTLPAEDPKNEYCKTMHFVDCNGTKYRITSPVEINKDISTITYECEHVIATLCDDVLFGSHVVGNIGYYTSAVIMYVLSKQTTVRWELDVCDFTRQYEYGWENENLLSSLFSIPKRFTTPYKWTYDTTKYPWKLSLRYIDTNANAQLYLRANKNLLTTSKTPDAINVCTRLYCLGYGEGINQLTIKEANNGIPYLQAPQEYIERFGLISRIFVDRRYETAQTLKERGEALLKELREPVLSYTCEAAELYEITKDSSDRITVGGIVMLTQDNYKTYIVSKTTDHDTDRISITISNKTADVATSIADLADRQRAEQVYAQGATQLYAQSIQANATINRAAQLNFYLPLEMKIINKVQAKISLAPFRSYSKATGGGGETTTSSSSGGGTNATSSSGGGINTTSSAGGEMSATSSAGGSTTVSSSAGGGINTTSSAGGASTVTSAYGGSSSVTSASNETTTITSSSGGETTATSSSGGGSTITSTSGGGTSTTSGSSPSTNVTSAYNSYSYPTTGSGGSSYNTSSSVTLTAANTTSTDDGGVGAANHNHGIRHGTWLLVSGNQAVQWAASGAHKHAGHDHTVSISSHTHSVTIPSHTHTVTIPSHSHSITIANHSNSVTVAAHEHTVKIPSHTHTVKISSHTHTVQIPSHTHSVSIPNHTHTVQAAAHTHTVQIQSHTHTVSITAHQHTVTAEAHTHSVTIPSHDHSVTIPAHTHTIEQGIFEFGSPRSATVSVNGAVAFSMDNDGDFDLTPYLLNANGKIDRGTWQHVAVSPDDLAYITIDLYVQGFIQSEGGSIY